MSGLQGYHIFENYISGVEKISNKELDLKVISIVNKVDY